MKPQTLLSLMLPIAWATPLQGDQPPANVAQIQIKHDRALIRELSEYLIKNPRAIDRDQAYAALFNKAIEHDWFAETEDQAAQYLKAEPDGPVRPLAQIILTMARAQAGQFDQALTRFRELMQGIGQPEQEEFASSFAESLAQTAISAGSYATAREVYHALLGKFGENPSLTRKVQNELKRIELVGKLAPPFDTLDVGGRPLKLSSYQGKYVLLDFWATWCSPCIAELPNLQAAYNQFHAAGFEIIGVSLDETKTAVTDFVKARRIPWVQIHNSTATADLVELFSVSSIPATYLIDPEGTVIRLDLRGNTLSQTLQSLLRPASTARTKPTATTR